MADAQKPSDPKIEGEGSYSGSKQYQQGVEATLRRGTVEQDAERARQEVEAHPEDYRKAEEEGKSHSAGELPGDES